MQPDQRRPCAAHRFGHGLVHGRAGRPLPNGQNTPPVDQLTAGPLNPEPIAYHSGFAVKWLIEAQINSEPALTYDPAQGDVIAPWLAWGPYLWADGLTPRRDGLTWACNEFAADGTHPGDPARDKVAAMLLDFFKTDETARMGFLGGE